jgi:L-alanine-DL-glutamate epimerase-like enolase superfamily enzyme
MATEITPGGLRALPIWLTEGATDFLRGDVVIKGGITGPVKIAHLAEAFCMNCEIHDGYNAMSNVAGLHVSMALAEPLRIDDEGFVHAPEGPGLGVDVDWDLIASAGLGEVA